MVIVLLVGGFIFYWIKYVPGLLVLDVEPVGAIVELNDKKFTSSDKPIKYWFKGQSNVSVKKDGFLSQNISYKLGSLRKLAEKIELNQMAYVGVVSGGSDFILGLQKSFINIKPDEKSIIFLYSDNKFHKFSFTNQEKTYLAANDNSQSIDIDLGLQADDLISSVKHSPSSKSALLTIDNGSERKIKIVDFATKSVKSLSSQFQSPSWLDDQSFIAQDKDNSIASLNSNGDILKNFGRIDQNLSMIFALSSEKIAVSKSDGSAFTFNIKTSEKKTLDLGDSVITGVSRSPFVANEAILATYDTAKNRNAYFYLNKNGNISQLPIFSIENNFAFASQDEIVALDYLKDRSGLEFYSYNLKTKQTKVLQNYKTDFPETVNEFLYYDGNIYFTDNGRLISFQTKNS